MLHLLHYYLLIIPRTLRLTELSSSICLKSSHQKKVWNRSLQMQTYQINAWRYYGAPYTTLATRKESNLKEANVQSSKWNRSNLVDIIKKYISRGELIKQTEDVRRKAAELSASRSKRSTLWTLHRLQFFYFRILFVNRSSGAFFDEQRCKGEVQRGRFQFLAYLQWMQKLCDRSSVRMLWCSWVKKRGLHKCLSL